MPNLNAVKTTLAFIFITLSAQLFSQTYEVGLVKGKLIDATSGKPLIGANVFIDLKSEEKIVAQSNDNGTFEIELPAGKHILKIRYLSYQNYSKEVTIAAKDTIKFELSICPAGEIGCCIWSSSTPYPQLQGFWKPVYYIKGNRKVDETKIKDRAGITFSFSNDTLPGKFSWEGNVGYLHFRHIKDGIIEVQDYRGLVEYIQTYFVPTNYKYSTEFSSFLQNMSRDKTNTAVTNNGQLLSLSKGDEKFVLQKIHNSTFPGFSTELFGTWKPINGKMNGKKIKKFPLESEIIFDWRTKGRPRWGGVIQYKDGLKNNDGNTYITYNYLDCDFISLIYISSTAKEKIAETKSKIGVFFKNLLNYSGCHLQFNETKDVVTLKYDDDFLVLKRKE